MILCQLFEMRVEPGLQTGTFIASTNCFRLSGLRAFDNPVAKVSGNSAGMDFDTVIFSSLRIGRVPPNGRLHKNSDLLGRTSNSRVFNLHCGINQRIFYHTIKLTPFLLRNFKE
jgi:hypothetical protein